jgi:arylsulfatase A-like enzyme
MRRQPDIVLLVLDTQRVDRLSCYGYPVETSPHLDMLAADSTRFAHATAPAQWTVPTHAAIFTGLYPVQHTVCQLDSVMPLELLTLAERLQQAGYFTAGFSHNPLIGVVSNGLQRGFHHFRNYHYLGARLLTSNLDRSDQPKNLPIKLRHTLRFWLAELLGYSQQTPVHALSALLLPFWKTALRLRGHSKSEMIRQSLTNVSQLLVGRRGLHQAQPIFAFVNLMGTHVPYDPPAWACERFLSKVIDQRSAQELRQQANHWQVDVCNWLGMELPEEEYRVVLNAFYDAETAAQDAEVGRFVNHLRATEEIDNTLFIVVADHGDHLGEKQRLNHAFGVYQELTHVPLIIRDPSGELPQGKIVEPFISTRRIFHTVLAAAGAATEDEAQLSLTHLGNDDDDSESEGVFSEGQPLGWAVKRLEKDKPGLVQASAYDQSARAIYADGYKLITIGERRELYDLRQDATEDVDLSHQLPQQMAALQTRLLNFVEQTQTAVTEVTRREDDAFVLKHLRDLGYLE